MNENELIQRSLEGNKEAMDLLVRDNWDRVFHHCLRLVQDEDIAKDLTQETFLKAFNNLSSFEGRSRFSTWIWKIAHNLTLSYLKKGKIKTEPIKEELVPNKVAEEKDPFMPLLQEAITILDEKHRVIFEMYDLEHIPQKEIAAKLEIPHGTVRSRLHYARQQIREYFKRHPYFE